MFDITEQEVERQHEEAERRYSGGRTTIKTETHTSSDGTFQANEWVFNMEGKLQGYDILRSSSFSKQHLSSQLQLGG